MDISRKPSRSGMMMIRLGLTLVVATALTSCNIEGFFTKYGDEPVWVDPNPPDKGVAGDVPGKKKYSTICAACHLGTGKGVPGNNIPPLAGSAIAQGDPTKPISIVLHGFRGEIVREGNKINGQMAAWQDAMSDQEIADVLSYVRSNWGNKGAAVTADDVKKMREATASRTTPYTEAELP